MSADNDRKPSRASSSASISSPKKTSFSSTAKDTAMYDDTEPTEHSPLLSTTNSLREGEVLELPAKKPHGLYSSSTIIWIMTAIVVLLASGDQLMETPQTRIIESIICYRHYENYDPSKIQIGREAIGPGALGGVPELLCKENAVQSQLATLRGMQQFLDGFPSLIMALPIGWAADRFGRRPFIIISVASFVVRASWFQMITWFWQSFDIRMTLLSTMHGFMAGSNPVSSALAYTALSDVSPEDQRAAIFLRLGAFNLIANVFMPPLAAWSMEFSPWIPSLSGTALEIMAVFLCLLLPETLNYRARTAASSTEVPATAAEALAAPPKLADGHERLNISFAQRICSSTRDALSFLTDDMRVPILIIPFFGHMLLLACGTLLIQYMSKRYAITFAKATLLSVILNAIRMLVLLIVLPALCKYFTRNLRLSNQRTDLYLSRLSQIVLAIGWLLVGLSPSVPFVSVSLIIASLGAGAFQLIRSFLTSLVPSHHIARVYSTISLVDTVGMMLGGPLLAGLFDRGIDKGPAWDGLPFVFLGLCMAVFAGVLFTVGMRKGEDGHESAHETGVAEGMEEEDGEEGYGRVAV